MSARGQDRGERTKKLFQHELFLSLPSSFVICWSCEDRPKTKEERRIKRFSQIFLVINWLFCILPSQAQQLCRNVLMESSAYKLVPKLQPTWMFSFTSKFFDRTATHRIHQRDFVLRPARVPILHLHATKNLYPS